MKKAFLIPLSILMVAIPVYADIYYEIELWSLLIIPAFFAVLLFPNWKVGTASVLLLTAIQLGIERLAPEIRNYDVVATHNIRHFLIDPITNVLVLLTLAYYRIKADNTMRQLEELAIHDALTGIYNRRYFDRAMNTLLETDSDVLLVLLDIDYYKNINDRYGHLCGDEVLKQMTKLIQKNVRGSDAIVRLGGEEFALIFPETDLEHGIAMAERVRKLIQNETFVYNGEPISITVSMGVAGSGGESLNQLMAKADGALYEAKNNGRNQIGVA